ncbi:MAG: hypothetical protein GY751_15255 [Bacteroidetes bacterium]|nr:hypothetical protein [Bacteroidota bacterium]
MNRKQLAYIDSVKIDGIHLQAFHFFLTIIWDEVEIADVQRLEDGNFLVDLAIADKNDSHLIMHLWEDWRSGMMTTMYSNRN